MLRKSEVNGEKNTWNKTLLKYNQMETPSYSFADIVFRTRQSTPVFTSARGTITQFALGSTSPDNRFSGGWVFEKAMHGSDEELCWCWRGGGSGGRGGSGGKSGRNSGKNRDGCHTMEVVTIKQMAVMWAVCRITPVSTLTFFDQCSWHIPPSVILTHVRGDCRKICCLKSMCCKSWWNGGKDGSALNDFFHAHFVIFWILALNAWKSFNLNQVPEDTNQSLTTTSVVWKSQNEFPNFIFLSISTAVAFIRKKRS